MLRFSRLFGIKPNLRFKKWKGMKKQKPVKTEAATPGGGEVDEAADAARELERAMERHTNIGPDGEWKFDYAPYPDDPNAYAEDQASTLPLLSSGRERRNNYLQRICHHRHILYHILIHFQNKFKL